MSERWTAPRLTASSEAPRSSRASDGADLLPVADDDGEEAGGIEVSVGDASDVGGIDRRHARNELREVVVRQAVQRELRGGARHLLRRLEVARVAARQRAPRERELLVGGRSRSPDRRQLRRAPRGWRRPSRRSARSPGE